MVDLAVHHLPHLARRPDGAGKPQQAHRVADRRERIAQLVGERRQELVLAAIGLLALEKMCARLVLALARAQRAAHGARQRRDAHRALEQRDVAERAHRARHGGGIGAGAREHQDRQIGPRRLALDQLGEAAVVRQRFLGDQDARRRRARARCDRHSRSWQAKHATASLRSMASTSAASLPTGREDQQPALEALAGQLAHSLGFFSGTPVSTPR